MPNARPLPYYDVRIQDEKNLLPPMTPDEIRAKVGKHLGSMVGDFAGRFFERFQAHNRALLEGAKLRLYKSRSEPDALRRGGHLGRGESDGICYLLQNLWHPPRDADTTVEDLLENPKVEVLESHEFPGIRVYKVRIAP